MKRLLSLVCLLFLSVPAWAQDAAAAEPTFLEKLDQAFGAWFVGPLATVMFFDLLFFIEDVSLPLVVAWLVVGAVFFTIRMGFINLRGFKHAIEVTAGRYDKHDDPGEVSHFQALSSALSATVGLGNIAGVAIAVSVGGPGAIFWMIVAGFLGMSSKFTECTLGQMYRTVDSKGTVLGGPMRYLDVGLKELGQGPMGKVLAVVFAVMCIGGSFGGGNMFQANQSYAAVKEIVPLLAVGDGLLYGVVLAFFVGLVILGGIKRIGLAAGIIVPVMCGVYVLAALYILLVNVDQIPAAFSTIITEAFAPTAVEGGIIGVLVQGFRRAAFSNEAGVGSASIAHSAASTDEPVREGIVALLEPFIDTIIVCTMTGLVVVITGAYLEDTGDGVLMTSAAFGSVIDWFPLVLSFAVVSFAFSTMISWCYYGERCATYLFGEAASLPYKAIFLLFVVFGSVFKLGNVLDFSDLMILGMAFPNILGMLLLSNKVHAALNDYWGRYTGGKMPRVS
jgi:AGCS family alanine or glycine:cation symporter